MGICMIKHQKTKPDETTRYSVIKDFIPANDSAIFQLSDKEKNNLLIFAINKSCSESTKRLIENGADAFSLQNDYAVIPIELAFKNAQPNFYNRHKNTFLQDFLAIIPDVTATDQYGNNLIHYACRYNQASLLQSIIDLGVDVNGLDQNDETPIFNAAFNNHLKCVEILVNNGAMVNAKNIDSEIPLAHSVWTEMNDSASFLIDVGADVNSIDFYGRTPLFNATQSDFRNVDLLLSHGADIDAVDCYGETPIFIAVKDGLVDMALHFIKRGADINHRNAEGQTPLFCAVDYFSENCVQVLLEHGADLSFLYHTDCDVTIQLSIDQVAKQISTDEIYNRIYSVIENNKLIRNIEDQVDGCGGLCF